MLATTGNTEYVHGDPMLCYKVTAMDWNGNESVPALLVTPLDAPLGEGALRFELEGAWPNPVVGSRLVVGFILPVAMPATLDLLDVSGRRIVSRQVGALGVGRHAVDLLEGKGLASGLFVVRLTQGANVKTQRVVMVR